MKKLLVITITLLFFGMIIFPSSGIQIQNNPVIKSYRGNTLYVGGSGSNNYTKIQDAIDNVSDGDTVFIYDDSSPYYENLQINMSINLIGEDRNTTIIEANKKGDVIFIASDGVSIHELTIQNSGGSGAAGIKVDIGFGFCTFTDNIINNNTRGIDTWKSCNNSIEGNTFFDNQEFAILFTGYCHNNTISDNIIDNSIIIWHISGIGISRSTGNNILGNIIKNSDYGICLDESDYNLVLNNTISLNDDTGIEIGESSNNTIIGNNISLHGEYGIYVYNTVSKDNVIYHNNFKFNYDNAEDEGNNTWDDGKYGNYWDDYEDRYPDAKKKIKEGIWDTPYEIDGGSNKDNCPLIKPWPKSKSKSVTSNIKEDCFECQSNGKTHLAEKILNRLEKDEVFSNVIKSDNPKEDPPICDYILDQFWHYVYLMDYYGDQSHKYENGSFMYRYYKLLCYMCFYTSFIYLCSAMLLDCDTGPYYS